MKKHGFTLVELIVSIAIVAVLIGLTLPAVNNVREAARSTACSNKMRQLAVGLLNFEASSNRLPAGLVSLEAVQSGAEEYLGMSWITRILPFVEQRQLWNQALGDYEVHADPFREHSGIKTVLSIVGCPSDPSAGIVHRTHEDLMVATTNYLGVSGQNFLERDGVFTVDRGVRLSMITDGLSNTLMLGERPPSPDFWYGWWYASGSGRLSTGDVTLGVEELNSNSLFGTAPFLAQCPDGPFSFQPGVNAQCDALHFWSYHPSGGFFCRTDGSVSFVNYSLDALVLVSLSTRSGGERSD